LYVIFASRRKEKDDELQKHIKSPLCPLSKYFFYVELILFICTYPVRIT